MQQGTTQASSIPVQHVTTAVVVSQMLFTAGHSLTTGGFLYYFISEFHAFRDYAVLLALAQVAPETFESFSLLTSRILSFFGSRKTLWLIGLGCGRIGSLLIPVALLGPQSSTWPIVAILGGLAVWHLLQGIAYCSYISWLSDLVPDRNWGRFFAQRKIAGLTISLIVPIAAGLLREQYLKSPELDPVWRQLSYAVIFLIGTVLVVCSVIPMLWIPDAPLRRSSLTSDLQVSDTLPPSADFRWLLASRWWLSFFQGLTQSILFGFSAFYLGVSVIEYYVMSSIMLIIQILTSWWAGRICDRQQDRTLLIWSLFFVSTAMLFLMSATPQRKWLLLGTYIIWGSFGFVNVALQNLTLKLAPLSENASHISLSRQLSGLFAGVAGLIGGLIFDDLVKQHEWARPQSYLLLFTISFLGRLTAPFWLFPIRSRHLRSTPTSV